MFANTRRIEKPPKYLQSCSYYVHCGSWWEMNLQKNAGGQNTFFKLAQVLKKQTSEPRWTKNRRPTWRTFLTYCLETLSLSLSLRRLTKFTTFLAHAQIQAIFKKFCVDVPDRQLIHDRDESTSEFILHYLLWMCASSVFALFMSHSKSSNK